MTTPETTIDDALRSGRVTATDQEGRELQELALTLSAESPVPSAEFTALMDKRVSERFPRPARRFAALPSLPKLPRPALPVLAAAASVIVALVVVASLIGQGGGSGDGSDGSSEGGSIAESAKPAAPGAARALSAQEDSIAISPPIEPPSSGGGIAPGERNRRIERSASLTLAAPGDKLDRVGDSIVAITDRRRGFVTRSSLSTGEEGTTGGSFELRVPGRELQPLLRDLSELADVRARTQAGEDITKAFVSSEDRLTAARAERRGLLRRLERADTDRQAGALRERLNLVAAEIRGLRGELRSLRERTNYAAVSVTLVEKDKNDGATAPGGGTGEAFDDFLGSLVGSLNLALRVLGVLIPIFLLGGLTVLTATALRRRRREAALR